LANTGQAFRCESFTASDGYALQYRRYSAECPRGHIVCLHGIQSHAGWYEYSCTRLRDAGFTVSFLDRRGSGLNEASRGDTPSYTRLLDDVAEFLQAVRAEQAAPVFVLAISWGGKIAVALEGQRPGSVDGLMLLCPGFFPRVRPPFRDRLRIARDRIFAPTHYHPIPLNDPELFTANPDRQKFLRQDPLSLHRATARFLVESVRLDRYIRSAPPHIRVPTLLLLAGQDRIIDNRRTRRYVEQFAAPDKTILEYPAAHHTLEFEAEPDFFIRDIVRWLEAHTSRVAS
jgi:alpha-beta hydrolase superfamily lysophospholipase